MVPFESLGTVSYSHSIVTMALLYHFRDKARYWSKIATFSYLLHSTPPLGGPHQNIAITFGMGKLEWCGYGDADGEKSLSTCLAVSTEYRCVTDGQTDGRTDEHLSTAVSALCIRVAR